MDKKYPAKGTPYLILPPLWSGFFPFEYSTKCRFQLFDKSIRTKWSARPLMLSDIIKLCFFGSGKKKFPILHHLKKWGYFT